MMFLRRSIRLPKLIRTFTTKTEIYALPFTIDCTSASAKFVENNSIMAENPIKTNALIAKPKKDPIRAVFIPFYATDISGLATSWSGKWGEQYISHYLPVTTNNTTVWIPQYSTRWYETSGKLSKKDYPLNNTTTQIYAGLKYPRNQIELVGRGQFIDRKNLKLLSDINYENKEFDEFINQDFAMEKINSILYDLELDRVKSKLRELHNYDELRIEITVHLNKSKIELYNILIPFYILQNHEYVAYYKYLNAFTAEVTGRTVLSVTKSIIVSGITGGLISAMIPWTIIAPVGIATAGIIIGRFIVGSIISGSAGSLYANFSAPLRQNKIVKNITAEIKRNEEFKSTPEDIAKQELLAKIRAEINLKVSKQESDIDDKYKLLNINPEIELTEEMLTVKYHEQIKLWHPDTYSGDKQIAEMMTTRINLAKKELEKKLNN